MFLVVEFDTKVSTKKPRKSNDNSKYSDYKSVGKKSSISVSQDLL